VERTAARAARNANAHRTGQRDGAQVHRAVGQVAEAFAEEKRRRQGTERLRTDALRAAATDVPVDTCRQDRLVLVALVELVLDARGDIVEAALGVAAVRPQLPVRRPEADAQVFC